ncbi:TPA: fimbria/pilus outer membrane usher protein [Salmonella enterica subsp. enterica serovar Virchow]
MAFKLKPLSFALMLISSLAYSKSQYSFDPRFLPEGVDISGLGSRRPEGNYLVDIYVNGQFIESRELSFSRQKTRDDLAPCLTAEVLYQLGVRPDNDLASGEVTCLNLTSSPYNSVTFNFNTMELRLTFPQQSLLTSTSAVSAQDIDDGIPAILLNYQGGTRLSRQAGRETRNDYINFTPGINVGGWRYRNQVSYTKNTGSSQWRGTYGALERGFFEYKSRLIIGEHYTQSTLYDNYQLTGLQLLTDEGMYSSSELEYTPIVKGVAESDSQIIIKQSGITLLSESVPAGPFAFPVYGTPYSGGQLDVEVIGINGDVKRYTVYNSSLPVMLKQGAFKYSAAVGQIQNSSGWHLVSQGEAFYGTKFNSTLYSGYQAGAGFLVLTLGMGMDLGVAGAVTTDITASKSREKSLGTSYTIKYNKRINAIDSSVNASLTQRAPEFTTLSDFSKNGISAAFRRNVSLSLWKSLNTFGSLSINLSDTQYHNRINNNLSASLGHQFNMWGGYISTSYSISREIGRTRTNKLLGVNLSFPFGRHKSQSLNYTYSRSETGRTNQTLGISGRITEDDHLNYTLQQTLTHTRTSPSRKSSYASATYFSPYGVYTGAFTTSNGASNQNYTASGGLIIHEEGVDIVQRMGETSALVSVDSVAGVKVGHYPGVFTNFRGFAVTPYLQAYRRNTVVLNEKETPEYIYLKNIRKITTPSRGAISRIRFDAQTGKSALIALTLRNGKKPPLGAIASVKNSHKMNTGIVDDGGELYMTGLKSTDKIVVGWGEQQCEITLTNEDFTGPELSLIRKTCL